jgi:TRAP-type uncharacterized transport system fused permease subunit
MPPVMGAAAFIMAQFLGISYWDIVVAAAIPAALYFFSIWAMVHFRAGKRGIRAMTDEEVPKIGPVLREGWHLLIPIITLVLFLATGYSAVKAVFWSIVCLVGASWLGDEKYRMTPKRVLNSLRMRPDRIIVGECRGEEAFDMLQAMNTGHDGSLTTLHANSPRDVLSRLESMVLMAGMELPVRAIREQISSGIDLIVHQERLKDGTRRVTSISEITGMEGDTIQMQDLFLFNHQGFDDAGRIRGNLDPTGIQPHRSYKFDMAGVALPSDILRSRRGI